MGCEMWKYTIIVASSGRKKLFREETLSRITDIPTLTKSNKMLSGYKVISLSSDVPSIIYMVPLI